MVRDPEDRSPGLREGDAITLLTLGIVLLRYRRLVYWFALSGLTVGFALALFSPHRYVSMAVFQPQITEARPSNLAVMAGRLGIPSLDNGGDWGAAMYEMLLATRALLQPIAMDTVFVAEKGGQTFAVMELLEDKEPNPARRLDRTLEELRKIIKTREIKSIGAVELTVTTPWPSVSLFLVQRLVHGVNRFNVETRKSQAAAERTFVELQTLEAQQILRRAEDRLLHFLQNNRSIAGSPELSFEHDRLQREVDLSQRVYTNLLQNLEDARIREVRDTPVITMLEMPQLPNEPEPRRLILKTIIGLLAGLTAGILVALLAEGWRQSSLEQRESADEFRELVNEAMPRFGRGTGH